MRVLLLGQNRELSLLRVSALENAGLTVINPETKSKAVQAIEQGDFDVAILSYTLSDETVQELSELIRQRCPQCPLIAISQTGWDDPKIRPDETILADDGPVAMLEALQRAHKKGIRRVK
jgi:CheY-like chemotaxis protein